MCPPLVSDAPIATTGMLDTDLVDHSTSNSSFPEFSNPNAHSSLHHDDMPVTSHDTPLWPSTHAPQGPSHAEKEIGVAGTSDNDNNGGGGEDQPLDNDGDVGMDEEMDDNNHEIDHVSGTIISALNHSVEVDMDDVTSSILQNAQYHDDNPFEPGTIEQATAAESLISPTLPHPDLVPLIHQLPGPGPAIALPAGTHSDTLIQLQQQLQDADEVLNDDELNSNHPMMLSNPNPMSLGPENPGVVDFLRHWYWQSQRNMSNIWPQVRELANHTPRRVTRDELKGDGYDFQGINWKALGVTRNLARNRRLDMYCNYVNKKDSDLWLNTYPDRSLPTLENFFKFKRMDVRNDVRLLHFQLRNIFGCASRARAFYPGYGAVQELDLHSGRNKVAIKFDHDTDAQISTLTASEDILLVGGFCGDYRYRCLDSEDPEPIEGRLTDNISGITNHVQIQSSRQSSAPLAAFASNDFGFRIVDLTTNKITTELMYDYAMNCSALSPDGRLRILVGDSEDVLVTDAENGEVLQQLGGHRDFGFACDWAPDGWTVATGNQDKTIRLWDARKWQNSRGESNPIAVIRTFMSGSRSLRFSPLGSGKRILVATEEADFIHAIDAQTLMTKQTFDIFGELGGVSFANDGQNLMVLSCDHHRGGVLQLERCDAGTEDAFDYAFKRYRDPRYWWRTPGYDWMQSPEQIGEMPGSQQTLTQRRRKAAMMDDLDPF